MTTDAWGNETYATDATESPSLAPTNGVNTAQALSVVDHNTRARHLARLGATLLGTLIKRTELLASIRPEQPTDESPGLAVRDFTLWWHRDAYTAVCRADDAARRMGAVFDRAAIEHALVELEKQRDGGTTPREWRVRLDELEGHAAHAAHDVAVKLVKGWADSLRRHREAFDRAYASADEAERAARDEAAHADLDIDRDALGDCGPDEDLSPIAPIIVDAPPSEPLPYWADPPSNAPSGPREPPIDEPPPSPQASPADPWQASLALARADVDRALGERRANERQPMFVPIAELFTREYPQTPWLVTGLITRGGVAVAGAQSKLGKKTWIVCEIALSVATGTKAFGEFFAERGTVGQFCAEDLAVQLRNRYRAECAGRGIAPTTLTNLHVCPRGQFIDVLKNEDLAWVIASCRAIGRVDLVILDPLRDVHSGIEDSSDSMRDVMRRLRLITELLGCTVLVTHHVPKTTQDNAKRAAGENLRGSGAIRGSLDAGIYVSPTGGDGVARFELSVISEVKGARSAGSFDLALAIEDDAGGEAVRATWTFSREDKATTRKATAADADDELVFQFVRQLAMRGEKLSRRALRDHDERPLSEKRFATALDRVIDGGRLLLSAGKVVLPEPTSSRGDS